MAVCIDPFSNTLNLSPLDWLKVAVLSLVLVPVRIVLCMLAVCLTWSCAYLVTVTMNEADLSTPLTGWRDVVRHYCCHQTYLWYWAMGFRVSVVGERADRDRAPVLVAAPHSSFLDLLLVPLCRASAVTKMENKTNPLIGVMQAALQMVYVDRRDKNSRDNTLRMICERATSEEQWPQLLICPEGTTTNGLALIQFKRGAFSPGTPVQPIVVRYPGNEAPRDLTSWLSHQDEWRILYLLWLLLANPVNHVQIEFLPVYSPSEEERKDPILYAKNVQLVMAEHIGIPATDITKTFRGKKTN